MAASVSGDRRLDVLRHDLRNQLNHLIGYSDLLLEELEGPGADPAPEPFARTIARIRTSSRQASAFLDAIDQKAHGANPPDLPDLITVMADQIDGLKNNLARSGLDRFSLDIDRMEVAAIAATEMAVELVSRGVSGRSRDRIVNRQATTNADRAVDRRHAEGRLLLVVDDDEDNRDLLARRLEKLGYSVVVAENGVQALGVLDVEPVELVLLDLMMPEMDGFEVLEQLNREHRMRDIPVVMISSESDISSVARCIQVGADDYLPKPFEPVLLQARVRASLEKKRLRDSERQLLVELQDRTDRLSHLNASLETRVSAQVEEINRLARLRRFLSPQLADLVVSSGEPVLHSHRRQIAVLFCDLRGFTAFSETAEPEEVMDVLREFHQAIGELTHRFEATVGFFAGDGIMVFFNDPVPCPNPPERAVRMAVALREAMEPMTRDWRRRDHNLGFGMGISYGYATIGEIGFEGRFDYGVIGSVVNSAARLCDHAASGQILVTRRAHLAVENMTDSQEIGELTLKGFHAPVTVFNVIRMHPASPAA